MIKNSILNNKYYLARNQFNLFYSILDYFDKGEEKMGDRLSDLMSSLRNKIISEQTFDIDGEDEYYFAVGQLVSYLISLNKSNNKTHNLINPILNCKDDKKLKQEIAKLFKKYNYDINKSNKKFNKLASMVLSYVPEKEFNTTLLIAGYLSNNLIYEKKEM